MVLQLRAMKFLSRKTMKGEKGTYASAVTDMSITNISRIALRFFQFIMGIVVIGLYAQDLDKARRMHKYADPKWIYAVFCGALSSIVALVFLLPTPLKTWKFFAIDALIWFFWVVLFGIFGKMYMKEEDEGNKGIIRMKHAAWIDMVNMILWFISAVYGGFYFWKDRKERRAMDHVV